MVHRVGTRRISSSMHRTCARWIIDLRFAEMKDPVKDKLERFGLFTRFGEHSFFATLCEAVSTYLATHPVEWVDWEDRHIVARGLIRIGQSLVSWAIPSAARKPLAIVQ